MVSFLADLAVGLSAALGLAFIIDHFLPKDEKCWPLLFVFITPGIVGVLRWL